MGLEDDLRAALKDAMKARDRAATTALRTALAALANAEAPVAVDQSQISEGPTGLVEHERLDLTDDDRQRILHAHLDDRAATIAQYRSHQRDEEADALELELVALHPFVTPREDP